MMSNTARLVMERAKSIYSEKLQKKLEREHHGKFVAIEPESGDYFLADTLDGAVSDAQERHPNRLTHTLRIGHRAALHLGNAEW
jgi:hypothetical protein